MSRPAGVARTVAVAFVVGVGAAVTSAAAPSYAASAESCQGQPATLVVAPGTAYSDGTSGADVVVVQTESGNAGMVVLTGAGDDAVCVVGDGAVRVVTETGDDSIQVGDTAHARVDGGPGDDRVDARAHGADGTITASLGDGKDTFLGGPEADRVRTDAAGRSDHPAMPFHDVVDSGGGNDRIVTGPREEFQPDYGAADDDDLTLGSGDDAVLVFGPSLASVTGGDGTDRLELDDQPNGSTGTLDATAGVLTIDSLPTVTFSGLESFGIYTNLRRLTIRGSDAGEDFGTSASKITGDLGGGDDRIEVTDYATDDDFADLDGGPGRDLVSVPVVQESASLNLGTGALQTGRHHARVTGFEDAEVLDENEPVTLTGTAGPNRLTVYDGCGGTLRGLGGDDILRTTPQYDPQRIDCYPGKDRIGVQEYGGAGADRLLGGAFADHLVGGAGRDLARGYAGRDRCSAETRRGCEAR